MKPRKLYERLEHTATTLSDATAEAEGGYCLNMTSVYLHSAYVLSVMDAIEELYTYMTYD